MIGFLSSLFRPNCCEQQLEAWSTYSTISSFWRRPRGKGVSTKMEGAVTSHCKPNRRHAHQERRQVGRASKSNCSRKSPGYLFAVCLLFLSELRWCFGFPVISAKPVQDTRDTLVYTTRRKEGNVSTSERWERKFNELLKFKEKYGHVNVPQQPNKDIPDDYRELGTFCRNIRSAYKYLQDPSKAHLSFLDGDRIQRLESIGFVWNSHHAT